MPLSKISFIGAGRIAEAWIERLLASTAAKPSSLFACDPSVSRLDELKLRYPGVKTSSQNADGAKFGDILVIATPPPNVVPVLQEMGAHLSKEAIVISLAAGIPLSRLREAAPDATVLRVMPNTPSMVGEGMNAVCFDPATSSAARDQVRRLLAIFGAVMEIAENDFETFGALCSVGPTFLFPIMDSLVSAAVAAGLSPEIARSATAQLFAGTGRLAAGDRRSLTELNGMIGLHTLNEDAACQLIRAAYEDALSKLRGLAAKMASA